MRKFALLVAAFFMLAASCNKNTDIADDRTPEEPVIETPPLIESNTIPVKLVMTIDGRQAVTNTITYQPNSKKIDSIYSTNGALQTFHYNGDLIERINYGTSGNDYIKFEYQNNSIIRETHYRDAKLSRKSEYSYPETDKITVTDYKNINNKWELGDDPVNLYFDKKGNLAKAESGNILVGVVYDDKNTPFLNVTGWSKIHFTGGVPMGDNVDFEDVVARRNNATKTTAKEGLNTILDVAFAYEFNDIKNPKFPTKITGTGKPFTVTITYK